MKNHWRGAKKPVTFAASWLCWTLLLCGIYLVLVKACALAFKTDVLVYYWRIIPIAIIALGAKLVADDK